MVFSGGNNIECSIRVPTIAPLSTKADCYLQHFNSKSDNIGSLGRFLAAINRSFFSFFKLENCVYKH